jgi:predicted transcriptional regulator
MGRSEADLTHFITYFCEGMAEAFSNISGAISRTAPDSSPNQTILLRELGARQRKLLTLFKSQGSATIREMAQCLNLGNRTLVQFCRQWIESGFLDYEQGSRKSRSYKLGARFIALLD